MGVRETGAQIEITVGDEVEIIYNPRKPWRFTFKRNSGWWDRFDLVMYSILIFICIIAFAHVIRGHH